MVFSSPAFSEVGWGEGGGKGENVFGFQVYGYFIRLLAIFYEGRQLLGLNIVHLRVHIQKGLFLKERICSLRDR